VDLDVDDADAVLEFVEQNGITLVVIGPEKPLVDGLTDFLEDYGHKVFGPSKRAALLEGSSLDDLVRLANDSLESRLLGRRAEDGWGSG
jgi:hypothetical protein